MLIVSTKKVDRLTRQAGWVRQVGQRGRWTGLGRWANKAGRLGRIIVPTVTANIFGAAINITKI